MAAIWPAYWARIQSSLKRLATNSVTREKSSATWAASGLIQVLNCCSGSSCASWSTQACHRLSPAPQAGMGRQAAVLPLAHLSLSPLWIVVIARSRGILICQNLIHTDVRGA